MLLKEFITTFKKITLKPKPFPIFFDVTKVIHN